MNATSELTNSTTSAMNATSDRVRHPAYSERYQRTKRRLGKQRGAKVAQVDIARRLAQGSGTC
jgi:hypothetical protein